MSNFRAPTWSDTFVHAIEADVTRLMGQQLWPIDSSSFSGWYDQFSTKEEKFFAAGILHRLTLRTKRQLAAALQAQYRGPLAQLAFPNSDDLQLVRILKAKSEPKLRLVPVLRPRDPPTKSGVVILRRLQRLFRFDPRWLAWPWQAAAMLRDGTIDRVIFVDDFLGSGEQFTSFFAEWDFPALLTANNMIYAPIVAHAKGISKVNTMHPHLSVSAIETLDSDAHFFDKDSWARLSKGEVSAADASAWYEDFTSLRGLAPKNIGAFGAGDLGLVFGFEHATPNNSLPLLWYSGSNWCALLDR